MTFRTVLVATISVWLTILSATAPAQSTLRPYQISILAATDGYTSASSDIPIFTRNVFRNYQAQPAGRSIAWLPVDANLDQHNIDWTRIVAVYVDEPYREIITNASACYAPGVAPRRQALANMAAAIRARAPRARFWVNFGELEIDLILGGCPLNETYIDVISMDVYFQRFYSAISDRYLNLLWFHRPTVYQQFALVPGTFVHTKRGTSLPFLQGYFDFAASMNQECYLPLGPTGETGIYDGCPVWMVAGWTGGVDPPGDALEYLPIDNPISRPLFDAWQTQFAIPRVDPSHGRHVRALLPLLIE